MDIVIRGVITYFLVWLIFRVSGKRTLAEATTFDFVLLLIISETTQNALTGEDHSLTSAFLLIVTLVGLDIALSFFCAYSKRLNRIISGEPILIVDHGTVLHKKLRRERVTIADILAAGRESQGIERLDQIKFAILEQNGRISIVPRK